MEDYEPRRTWRQRLLTLAAIMGPGLIVMVGDNDAGGIATYAQAGQNYGYSLLWLLLLLIPVLIVNQEMVVRLGAVTGVGHAKLINERFGRFWAFFSVGDLFVLNFLTIATEFIGISLAASYFGISPYLAVPLGAGLLIAITLTGNFRRWERAMFVFLIANLLIIPLALLSHPDPALVMRSVVIPGIKGGFSSDAVLLIIAIVGTTVAPWQLFFQQSNVVDKRITPRWMAYERADTVIGAFVVVIGAAAVMMAAAAVFGGTPQAGKFTDALGTAIGLRQQGGLLGSIFAILLIDASIIGAGAITLATSYAFGDVFGIKHSLHRGFTDAKAFYGSYTAMVALAAGLVLIPGAPLGLITTAVQALAGILLPSATVFLLLLCNDREVLGPWVNSTWLNVVATVIVSALVELSLILVANTALPALDLGVLVVILTSILVVVLVTGGVWLLAGARRRRRIEAPEAEPEKSTWRMPPLALLARPEWSMGRKAAMLSLQIYLVVVIGVLVLKAVRLATGH